jgi:hypothetical protein
MHSQHDMNEIAPVLPLETSPGTADQSAATAVASKVVAVAASTLIPTTNRYFG